jgi:hypothetical protein
MFIYKAKVKGTIIKDDDGNEKYIPVVLGVSEESKTFVKKEILLLNNNDIRGYFVVCDLIDMENKKYKKLLMKSSMTENNCLYFIEFEKIIDFDVKLKKTYMNTILEKKIKISADDFALTQYEGKNLLKTIMKEVMSKSMESNDSDENSNSESSSESDDGSDDGSDESDNESEKSEDKDLVSLGIPILWILCDVMIKNIENKKISKKKIKHHLLECKECEINDNNSSLLDVNREMSLVPYYKNYDKVLDCYERSIRYKNKLKEINILKDNNKDILLLLYNKNEEYGDIIFII